MEKDIATHEPESAAGAVGSSMRSATLQPPLRVSLGGAAVQCGPSSLSGW